MGGWKAEDAKITVFQSVLSYYLLGARLLVEAGIWS